VWKRDNFGSVFLNQRLIAMPCGCVEVALTLGSSRGGREAWASIFSCLVPAFVCDFKFVQVTRTPFRHRTLLQLLLSGR
jgi:hypothetical protein